MKPIRDLFQETEQKTPPLGHRQKMQSKLKVRPRWVSYKYQMLAACIAAIVGLFLVFTPREIPPENNFAIQDTQFLEEFEAIEHTVMLQIDAEWEQLQSQTKDTALLGVYEEKLHTLQQQYLLLETAYRQSPNDIATLESLIQNLQLRLQALKQINQQLQQLQSKNIQHETIYL
ncbi:MAG: hypothetical protein OIF50_07760 [Flavobacteriaceae bacterium]|nr:hypothetical protein [Flavobacteriaceae bacterium]